MRVLTYRIIIVFISYYTKTSGFETITCPVAAAATMAID